MAQVGGPIGMIGAGQMATALARGWCAAGLVTPTEILASARTPTSRSAFEQATGCRTTPHNAEVMAHAETLVLAVKPAGFPTLCEEIRPFLKPTTLVISVAAGVTLAQLAEGLGNSVRLVRVMPNTPVLVGEGACGYSFAPTATPADRTTVETLLQAVGLAVEVTENLIDAVIGVAGSGPAYAFVMIEALADAGVRAGLSRAVALQLAAQTLLGAGKMVRDTGTHPAVLKDRVASPGGTTIAALASLEATGFRSSVMSAVAAATERGQQLANSAAKGGR